MPGCPSYTLCLKTRPEPEPNGLFLGPYNLCLARVAPGCKFVSFTDMCCMLKVASSGWPAHNARSMKPDRNLLLVGFALLLTAPLAAGQPVGARIARDAIISAEGIVLAGNDRLSTPGS